MPKIMQSVLGLRNNGMNLPRFAHNSLKEICHISSNLSQDFAVVDFWAEWCAFCKQLAPIYEDVSNEVTNVKFVKVNVENEMDLAQKYGVQGIPVIKFFCNGKEVDSVVGLRTKDQLKQDIIRVRAEAESCATNSSEMKQ